MTNIEKYIIKPFDEATDDEKRLVGPSIFGNNLFLYPEEEPLMYNYLDSLNIPHEEQYRDVIKFVFSIVQHDKDGKITLEEALRVIKEIRETGGKGPYKIKD
ncbi:hypothetical protein [Nosocomiicoccus massiliensis]|uniref:hypothetical protein n=1 Tax=Nosocomiicoccus massiliensis TaxID=1232430 RepID=UPI0004037D1E|nr:hypothetical protein [Nosocomiicoccus massiliensis]